MVIRLNLRDPKAKISTIRAIIRMHGHKHTLSTGIRVYAHQWNHKKERSSDHALNIQLNQIKTRIIQFYVAHDRLPTAEEISIERPKPEEGAGDSLAKILENFENNFRTRKNNAHKKYAHAKSIVARFHKARKTRCPKVSSIDNQYLQDLIQFMADKPYSNETMYKVISTIKTVMRSVMPSHLIPSIPCPPKRITSKIYLTPEEIQSIEHLDLPYPLNISRDAFLIQCYTAVRYSDINQIKIENTVIENKVMLLKLVQTKTDL